MTRRSGEKKNVEPACEARQRDAAMNVTPPAGLVAARVSARETDAAEVMAPAPRPAARPGNKGLSVRPALSR